MFCPPCHLPHSGLAKHVFLFPFCQLPPLHCCWHGCMAGCGYLHSQNLPVVVSYTRKIATAINTGRLRLCSKQGIGKTAKSRSRCLLVHIYSCLALPTSSACPLTFCACLQTISLCGTTQCNATLGGGVDCAYGVNCPYFTYQVQQQVQPLSYLVDP
jgi:hypothetical protein